MNGILLVDKPADWTSQDVTAKLRGVLHERRIGHCGTLDPMATGLLGVFCGRATRAVSYAEAQRKEYIAGITFGLTTDTQDITGRELTHSGSSPLESQLQSALLRFTGEISQVPPMYSAIQVNGKRLYALARAGVTVERAPRTVTIDEIELCSFEPPHAEIRVVCSKGTYIRTLCADIGQALGCGACMSSLRRTRIGNYLIAQAHTLPEIIVAADNGNIEEWIMPTDSIFAHLAECKLDEEQTALWRNGAFLPTGMPDGLLRLYGADGAFLALARAREGQLRSEKNFFEVVPQ